MRRPTLLSAHHLREEVSRTLIAVTGNQTAESVIKSVKPSVALIGTGPMFAGGPGRAASDFSELGGLVSVGYEDPTEFPDEAVASRGCRARNRAGNCAQRPTQGDRVTRDVERA